MSLNVTNASTSTIDFLDSRGKVINLNPGVAILVEELTPSLWTEIQGGRAVASLVNDQDAKSAAVNANLHDVILNVPLPVTCTAGAAILSAAQLNLLGAATPARTIGISAASGISVGTATTTPILPDGLDGQRLTLLNVGAQTITISDQGTMAASNLRLTAATVAIAARQSVNLMFSATIGDWVQTGGLVAVI